MVVVMDEALGLRERKKLATRQALSWAAIHLATERGLENLHVEDIAAAAGVSPRTYNNYFSSKEEAICAMAADRAVLIGATLLERPAVEPLVDALLTALLTHYRPDGELDRDYVTAVNLMMTSPALRGEFLKTAAVTEEHLTAAIATRTGIDPATDIYPKLVAAVATTGVRVGIAHWLATPGSDFTSVLESAIRRALADLT
jgi:AcrR family transcriptional regulator